MDGWIQLYAIDDINSSDELNCPYELYSLGWIDYWPNKQIKDRPIISEGTGHNTLNWCPLVAAVNYKKKKNILQVTNTIRSKLELHFDFTKPRKDANINKIIKQYAELVTTWQACL